MGNFFPDLPQQQYANIPGQFQAGVQTARDNRGYQKGLASLAAQRQYVPQILSGDPGQQTAAIAGLAGVDPSSAGTWAENAAKLAPLRATSAMSQASMQYKDLAPYADDANPQAFYQRMSAQNNPHADQLVQQHVPPSQIMKALAMQMLPSDDAAKIGGQMPIPGMYRTNVASVGGRDRAITTNTSTGQMLGPQGGQQAPQGQQQAPQQGQQQGQQQAPNIPPQMRDMITQAAMKYGVPPEMGLALAQQESSFNPSAVGPPTQYGQARGLFQYIPSTAQSMGIDPTNPAQSADAAMKQFAQRMQTGGVQGAIAGHFAGDDPAQQGPKTAAYVQQVMAKAQALGYNPQQGQQQPLGVGNGVGTASGPVPPPQALQAPPQAQQAPPPQFGTDLGPSSKGAGGVQYHMATPQELQAAGLDQSARMQVGSNGEMKPLGMMGQPTPLIGDPTKTGKEYLATIPAGMRNTVVAIAGGQQAPPSSSSRSPQAQALLQAVYQYDQTANASNLPVRTATYKDFRSGKSAAQINAINTAIGHLQTYAQDFQKLDNYSGVGSSLLNTGLSAIRGFNNDPRLNPVNTDASAIADELTRVYRQAGGTEADINSWKAGLKTSNSTESAMATVKSMGTLLQSKLDSLQVQYSNGIGNTNAPLPILTPHAQAALESITGQKLGGSQLTGQAPQQASQAPTTKTINGEIFVNQNGQWFHQ